jgi:hypothetical protein
MIQTVRSPIWPVLVTIEAPIHSSGFRASTKARAAAIASVFSIMIEPSAPCASLTCLTYVGNSQTAAFGNSHECPGVGGKRSFTSSGITLQNLEKSIPTVRSRPARTLRTQQFPRSVDLRHSCSKRLPHRRSTTTAARPARKDSATSVVGLHETALRNLRQTLTPLPSPTLLIGSFSEVRYWAAAALLLLSPIAAGRLSSGCHRG